MQIFLRLLLIFFYFFLTLFINNCDVLAYENSKQSISQQHYISLTKHETEFANKKEENYIILQNRNKLKITNQTNKNDNYNSANFNNSNSKLNILSVFKSKPITNVIYITNNISPNLKHTIHTRAP